MKKQITQTHRHISIWMSYKDISASLRTTVRAISLTWRKRGTVENLSSSDRLIIITLRLQQGLIYEDIKEAKAKKRHLSP